jgi:hypothetical protein
MNLKQYFLNQLDREADHTRKALLKFPEGNNAFKPHEKSMEFGYLAALIAKMPDWIATMIDHDELNFGDPSAEGFRAIPKSTREELIASLDASVANGRRALEATNDQHLATQWAFKMNGQPVWGDVRSIMISDAVFAQLAHHRGQYTVYLRLLDAKVPALYGPSADER